MDERVIEQIKNVKLPDSVTTLAEHYIFEQKLNYLRMVYEDLRERADLIKKKIDRVD